MRGRAARRLSLVLAVAVALAAARAADEAAGEARDRRRHPPPGRLVDVGGRRLHIMCAGQGTPAVVIITALGGPAADWAEVQRVLAQDTCVCLYDRAGLGWSESPRRRRTAVGMAAELHALLEGAGIGPPYVLAGHSLGGLIAQVFASLYPAEVAGIVLIDSSHPRQSSRLPKTHLRHRRGGKLLEAARDWARPLGLRRASRDLGIRSVEQGSLSSRGRRADLGELLAFDGICRDTARLVNGFGALPLTVITSSERDPNVQPGSRAYRARDRSHPEWARLQDELAALSTDSEHIVAARAGHFIHRDDPDLVTDAITALVHGARSAPSATATP
jgi:pimeloyl-ACP methyl ester carboxylesterase